MTNEWSFGDEPAPAPVRQPMRLTVTDKRTGERPTLELTAELGLDAGTLLTALANSGGTDSAKLIRALTVLRVALVDDDGAPSTWIPDTTATGDEPVLWVGYDGATHADLADALPALAESSSRRKLIAVVEDDSRWQVHIGALDAMATRIVEAASGGRPTVPATPSSPGRGSAGRGSRAASGSAPRRSRGAGS